jgi:hypothetical protein
VVTPGLQTIYSFGCVNILHHTMHSVCYFFIVHVDTNSEIDPVHVLKTVLLDLSKM